MLAPKILIHLRLAIVLVVAAAQLGCVHESPYAPPAMTLPAQFGVGQVNEGQGGVGEVGVSQNDVSQLGVTQTWVSATPADAFPRGAWWELFNDTVLNELAASVDFSNQDVLAAKAAYDQARALAAQQGAPLYPSVDGRLGVDRGETGTSQTITNRYQASIGATWEADVWGRLTGIAKAAKNSARASAADLAAVRLAAQGELGVAYFSLRLTDIQYRLTSLAIETYQRALQITQNRFAVGVTTKTDVLQAQTQFANAQSDLLTLQRQRERFAHAIAVLVGKTPEEFSLAVDDTWQAKVPDIPLGLPSELLQRRPDIAAVERRVAAANEQIGVARAGYFPSLKLNASDTKNAASFSDLVNVSTSVWSLGVNIAQNMFDAGSTRARVSAAKAAHQQVSARYRQTVLSALEDVENQLTIIRVLAQQYSLRKQAAESADQVENFAMNRYRQGQISFTEVVNAQTTAFNARRALAQNIADSQTARVVLIQALGGGWQSGADKAQ